MVKRPSVFSHLSQNYLFAEIKKKVLDFQEENPAVSLVNLGIGDTVKPIAPSVSLAMQEASKALQSEKEGLGYGEEQGLLELRKQIAKRFYKKQLEADEIFISDGAKCDIGRLQLLFGRGLKIGLQDPAYPVYLEGSLLQGAQSIFFLPASIETHFFPDFDRIGSLDLLYICHPNNPTGVAYSRAMLEDLVAYALKYRAIILFDVAYAAFIQDPQIPRSIYEIKGAEKVAIEIGSFSKMAGFSGIRLGWTVVPKNLKFESKDLVWKDWKRLTSTIYNGASYIAQKGGIAVLSDLGWQENQKITSIYQNNAKRLKKGFEASGFLVLGGEHSPYLWVYCPHKKSWGLFQYFLEENHLIVTPGRGFGKGGEHFVRVSGFAHESDIDQALISLQRREVNQGT